MIDARFKYSLNTAKKILPEGLYQNALNAIATNLDHRKEKLFPARGTIFRG